MNTLNVSNWPGVKGANSLREIYSNAKPFPHVVIDSFLPRTLAMLARREFPPSKENGWIYYYHFNERKKGNNRRENFSPFYRRLFEVFQSEDFIGFLGGVTGIKHLMADPLLEGGGVHETTKGGFLNIHSDFSLHPTRPGWQRRLNVLVFLSRGWKPAYGAELEFWDKRMKHCVKKIEPIFNRCVIFETGPHTFHGHPDPMTCPPDFTRRSLALYYYTPVSKRHFSAPTRYRARPKDRARAPLIHVDNFFLSLYSLAKRSLRLEDSTTGSWLRQMRRIAGFVGA